MECPICSFDFDDNKKQPLLCKCGNSVCKDCITLLVQKKNNVFTCPLCRTVINPYSKTPLPVNRQISSLVAELDCLRSPTKEKSSLTEPLVSKSIQVQSKDYQKPPEFNEYITVTGISFILITHLPWVRFI